MAADDELVAMILCTCGNVRTSLAFRILDSSIIENHVPIFAAQHIEGGGLMKRLGPLYAGPWTAQPVPSLGFGRAEHLLDIIEFPLVQNANTTINLCSFPDILPIHSLH